MCLINFVVLMSEIKYYLLLWYMIGPSGGLAVGYSWEFMGTSKLCKHG